MARALKAVGTQAADPAAVRAALRESIVAMLPPSGGIELTAGRTLRLAVVGPSGAGKTTTIAKLAAAFKLRTGCKVGLLSLDARRPAADEQLRRYAEIIGVPMVRAPLVTDVHEQLRAVQDSDLLLIDTPGVSWREQGPFARLAALLRAARPDEVHLALPASMSAAAQARAAQAFGPLKPARLILTRLDEAVGFGVILNVVDRLALGLSYISAGQNVPRDLDAACGRKVAELVCPLSSQARTS